MFIGMSVDGNWFCESFVAGRITEKQFIENACPFRIRKAIAEYRPSEGMIYVWNKDRKKKPWEQDDKDYRASVPYREWRLAVFVRDSFTCQKCGTVRTKIEAHHIKTFNKHPALRFEVSNGTTLCRPCHIEEHRGRKNGTD